MAANDDFQWATDNALDRAALVVERCDLLARCSEEPDRLTRRYGTAALRDAQTLVADWMTEAGLTVRRDAIGNLIGRSEGNRPGARTLLFGSHLDSVRDAGKYDGPLGVLVALAVVARRYERGERLPFAVEVVAFADEEGLRFHRGYLGSRAVAGTLNPTDLALADDDGVTLEQAIADFGGDAAAIPTDARAATELLGYVEVHIEQGPILEAMGAPVGVVSAIAGQTRIAVDWTGEAGHAGTVPMALRRDALAAAAEFVLAVETTARTEAGLVATVGQMTVEPGASNVVPGRARLSLDVRHADDATRARACRRLREQAVAVRDRRRVGLDWRLVEENDAVRCDPEFVAALSRAVEETGVTAHRLISGAGHDAVAFAALTPVAMLFVRCAGGISHHPVESVARADVAVAIATIDRYLATVDG